MKSFAGHLDGEMRLDEVVALLNTIDFEALNAEISKADKVEVGQR